MDAADTNFFYIALGVVSAILSAFATWILKVLALKYNLVDKINERKIHSGQIPRLGGTAIWISFSLTFAFAHLLFPQYSVAPPSLQPLIVGAFLSLVLGTFDDIFTISAKMKLLFQITIGLVVWALGFKFYLLLLPFDISLELGLLSLPITIIWIVLCMNVINLIDGLDALCSGLTITALGAILLLDATDNLLTYGFVLVPLIGATIGFIVHNFPPAKIFLGDGGSYFLGFCLAFLIGNVSNTETGSIHILPAALLLGVPLVDTTIAIIRRLIRKKPIFQADNGHLHHRFLNQGFSTKKTLLVMCSIQIVFSTAAAALLVGSFTVQAMGWFLSTSLVGYLFLVTWWNRSSLTEKPESINNLT